MKRIIATTVVAALGLGCLQVAEGQEAPAQGDVQTLPSGSEQEAGQPVPEAPAPPAEAVPQNPEPVAPNESNGNTVPVTPPEPAEPTKPPVAQDDSKQSIEEVVVTARRTKESQQDVPVAITAFSADTLKREQINSAQDLEGRVPSLVISSNGQTRNTETPTVRGQGATYGSSPGVVMYYAEVPLPADFPGSIQGGPGKFFDVSNLQVLKGSQGTLFGRNTTGGALLIEPHKPDNFYSASLTGEFSSYSGENFEGVLNLPIVDDTLLMRAGVKYFDRNGFTNDVSTGASLDNKHFWTARLGLTWRPTERIENYLLGYYTYSDDNGTGTVIEGFNKDGINYGLLALARQAFGLTPPTQAQANQANLGCLLLDFTTPSTSCGQDVVAQQQARGIRSIATSLVPFDKIKTNAAIDHFSFNLNDELTLRNIASYTTFAHAFNWDADGSIAKMQDIATPPGQNAYAINQTTEEMQLQGKALNDRLKFAVGGYYQRVQPDSSPLGQSIAALGIPLPAASFTIKQQSYAPYAQGTYDMAGLFDGLQGLNFTAGARYTTDKTDGSSSAGGTDHSSQLTSRAATYTAGLDYKIATSLVYSKISRGYKAGGFAATAVVADDYTYKPEYVTNYEIGQKSDFKIGSAPARFNAALYYTDYSDMQRGGVDSKGLNLGSAIFTAGSASIYGLELDALVEPFDGFRVAANYAYTRGRYIDFNLAVQGANPQLDCSGQLVPTGHVANLACAPFQFTPRNQASLTTSYALPIGDAHGVVNASVTYVWTDAQYSSSYSLPEAEPGAWLQSYGLLNANLSWTSIMGSSFDLTVFGTNLTNKEYRISNSNVWNLAYYRSSIYGEPIIVGTTLSYHWGR